jgi:hypothetical protein
MAERALPASGHYLASASPAARGPSLQIVNSPTALHRLDHIVAGHTMQGKAAMLGAEGVLYKPVQVRHTHRARARLFPASIVAAPRARPVSGRGIPPGRCRAACS